MPKWVHERFPQLVRVWVVEDWSSFLVHSGAAAVGCLGGRLTTLMRLQEELHHLRVFECDWIVATITNSNALSVRGHVAAIGLSAMRENICTGS